MRLLDILVVFWLDFGQIRFCLAQKAFATQKFALLATSIPFYEVYDIWARVFTEINEKENLRLYAFRFLNFFLFSHFCFSFLFAAVIGLLLGLLTVKKLLSNPERDGQI